MKLLVLLTFLTQLLSASDNFCLHKKDSNGMPGYVSEWARIACSDGARFETKERSGLILIIPIPTKNFF